MEYPKMINVRVTEQDHQRLAKLAQESECFMSDLVRDLIAARLAQSA
jgi:predicted HicB family RNase H-like nuclease